MKTSKHSLSRYNITALESGKVYAVGCREVVPGDSFQHAIQAMIRLQPMTAPTMHPIHATIEHFFVPTRLLWENWEDFITGGPDGNDASVMPQVQLVNPLSNWSNCLYDYLGVQDPGPTKTLTVSALPARAYAKIFNEYYRDQDLVSELPISYADGIDSTTPVGVQNIAWRKDHFTTARPFAAKGPSVQIPVSNTASVRTNATSGSSLSIKPGSTSVFNTMDTSGATLTKTSAVVTGTNRLYVDASEFGIDPEDLRTGMAWHKWQELRARYGSRYTEYLRVAFGVISPDQRLQRPEYLGGGSQTIQMSEVLQTSNPGTPTDPEDATGALKGHGIGTVRSNAYRRFFQEHGYVISMMHIRPVNIYRDGMDTHFLKTSKFDYYQREFEALGSQGIRNGEVFATGTNDQDTWGYQDRYYDYRRCRSYVSGSMRNTFNFWHEARQFSSLPALNANFVTCVPSDRIFAAPVDQNYMVMIYDKCVARRPVAKIGMSSNFRA